MNNIESLVKVLNAALEHVPASTRAILAEIAQPLIAELEKENNGHDKT